MIRLKRLNFTLIHSSMGVLVNNIETFLIFNAVRSEDIVYPIYLSHRIGSQRAEYNSKIMNKITNNQTANNIRNFIYGGKKDNVTNGQKQTILSQLTSNPKYSTQEEVNAAFDEMVGSKYTQNFPETYLTGEDGSGIFSAQRMIDEGISDAGDRFVSVIMNPLERFIIIFMNENNWGKTGETVNRTAFRNWISSGEHQNLSPQKSGKQYNLLDYNGTTGEWWCADHIKDHLKQDFIEYYDISTTDMVSWETIMKHNRKKILFASENLDYHNLSTQNALQAQYPEDFDLYDSIKTATDTRFGT